MYIPLLSIFFIVVLGFLAKKMKILEQKNSSVFINFVLCFALPALIFDKIYHINIDIHLLNIVTTGFFASAFGATISLCISLLFKFSRATTVSVVMLSFFGNTLFVGIPVIEGFFGRSAVDMVIFYDQVTTSIPIAILGPVILSFGVKQRVSLLQNCMKILKFPPFISVTLALTAKSFSDIFVLPQELFTPLRMISSSVTPVALFAVGLGLNFGGVKSSYKGVCIVMLCRMVAPAVFFVLVVKIFNFEINQTWLVGMMLSTMPPMVLASAMIMKAELDSSLAVSSVALGVAFGFVTLPIIYMLFAS
ncbi:MULTISPECIES: AEC family transporter [unclassified Campylobacter]|uniref:AEC family transporter n=1 Tax=unclassified Campylobacter TaxID=2593542 RepID=UPI003D34B4DC